MFGLFKKKPKSVMDEMNEILYGSPLPPHDRADLTEACRLAHENLLGSIVPFEEVEELAQTLHRGPVPHTTQDLALSVAVNFYKEAQYTSPLAGAQLFARMEVLEWLQNGLVQPLLVQSFENDLYKLYQQ